MSVRGRSRSGRADSRFGHVGFPLIAIDFCDAAAFRDVPFSDIIARPLGRSTGAERICALRQLRRDLASLIDAENGNHPIFNDLHDLVRFGQSLPPDRRQLAHQHSAVVRVGVAIQQAISFEVCQDSLCPSRRTALHGASFPARQFRNFRG
jgi:hypothetical protein